MKNEPVLVAITALVGAAIGLLVAFGVHVTQDQTGAIVAFVAAAYVVGGIVRSLVTPTRKTISNERGQSLTEVAIFLLIIVVAFVILKNFL